MIKKQRKIAVLKMSPPDKDGNRMIVLRASETTEVELEVGIRHELALKWISKFLDESQSGVLRKNLVLH